MNILIIGSGGREHALAWKIAESPRTTNLYIAPGNAGTRSAGTNIPLNPDDFQEVKKFVIEKEIDMVVVGPEQPLVHGFHDFFLADKVLQNIPVIGPVKAAAMLEGSKDFAKKFMIKYGIPTAAYQTFTKETLKNGYSFLEKINPPYVLKADGLAAGKGVLIIDNLEEAKKELAAMLDDAKFGQASEKVVIEEFLKGIELSVFVLTDGKTYKILPEVKDYKRIGEGDTGLNTGGMGSVSPVKFATKEFMQKVEDRVIKPTIEGLKSEKLTYKGFIFFGLIKVNEEPFVIEYNCRLGDPEAESVIPRIKSDLVHLLEGVAAGTLENCRVQFDDRYAATVMLVSGGYPEKYEKGKILKGTENLNNCIVFHAGTSTDIDTEEVKTSGGRVLAITSYGYSMEEALANAYKNVELVKFDGKYFRRDIGFDLKITDK
ncbi:MAG TPA: phosphoribosylamine--glycine ligase [Bacteroidales bacterium]